MITGGWPQVDSGLVALGIAIVTFIAWLSRLESKTSMNSRDLLKLEGRINHADKKTEDLDTRVMDKLSRIEQIVATIQGQLSRGG
jgi:hypothetical protein